MAGADRRPSVRALQQDLSSTRIAVVDIGDPDAPDLVERIDLQDVDGYVTTAAGSGTHLFVGCHARGRVSIHARQADAHLARVGQLGEPATADAPVAPTDGGAFVLQEQHELAFYAGTRTVRGASVPST